MPAAKARPRDFTGAQKAKLASEHAEELKAREKEIAMMAETEAEARKEVVDLTADREVEVEQVTPTVKPKHMTMRVNDKLEQMTYGVGNYFDFEPGTTYKVPVDLYEHLDALGYVWH